MGTFLLFFFTLFYNGHMVPNSTSSNRTDDSMMMRQVTSNAANDGTFETTCLDRSNCRYSENENRCANDDLPFHPFTSIYFHLLPAQSVAALIPSFAHKKGNL
jgi:hypothetical protein